MLFESTIASMADNIDDSIIIPSSLFEELFGTKADGWQKVYVYGYFQPDSESGDDDEFAEIRDDVKSCLPRKNPHLSLQATSSTRRDFSTHQIAYRRKLLQQARDKSSYTPKSAEYLRRLMMISSVSSRGKYPPHKKSTSRQDKRSAAFSDFTVA